MTGEDDQSAEPYLTLLGKAVGRAVIALVIAVINPFNTISWSEQRSHETWELVQAPIYGGRLPVGRNEITIVSLNEQTFSALKLPRPLPMYQHGFILADVMQAGGTSNAPAAIFVDLLFNPSQKLKYTVKVDQLLKNCGDKNSFECYVKEVADYTKYSVWNAPDAKHPRRNCHESIISKLTCIREAGGTPIFFAGQFKGDTPGLKGDNSGFDSELSEPMKLLDRVAIVVPAFIDIPDYPLVQLPSNAPVGDIEKPSGHEARLSPAAALYAWHCLEGTPPVCNIRPEWEAESAWLKAFTDPVDVKWATGGEDDFTRREGRFYKHESKASGCRSDTGGVLPPIERFWALLFHGIHFGKESLDCPYTHNLPYQFLVSQIMTMSDVQAMISGKIILIGSTFENSPDMVPSAPNGALPGVYAHAMALDTLIEKGEKYPRYDKPVVSFLDIVPLEIILAAIVLIFSFCADLVKTLADRPVTWRLWPSLEHNPDRAKLWPFQILRILTPWLLAGLIYLYMKPVFERENFAIGLLVFGDTGLVLLENITPPLRHFLKKLLNILHAPRWIGIFLGFNGKADLVKSSIGENNGEKS